MSVTNAERHLQAQRKGEWRTAHSLRRCSHYFGNLAACTQAIPPGKRYFDTQENAPDAGIFRNFIVCGNCANSPHESDFLAEKASEAP